MHVDRLNSVTRIPYYWNFVPCTIARAPELLVLEDKEEGDKNPVLWGFERAT